MDSSAPPESHDSELKDTVNEVPAQMNANEQQQQQHAQPALQHIDQSLDESPLRYGNGNQQYCLVQVRQGSCTGRYLQTFGTLAIASKKTNLQQDAIQHACFQGGGVVGDKYFEFVTEKGEPVSNQTLSELVSGRSLFPTGGGGQEQVANDNHDSVASGKNKRPREEATTCIDSDEEAKSEPDKKLSSWTHSESTSAFRRAPFSDDDKMTATDLSGSVSTGKGDAHVANGSSPSAGTSYMAGTKQTRDDQSRASAHGGTENTKTNTNDADNKISKAGETVTSELETRRAPLSDTNTSTQSALPTAMETARSRKDLSNTVALAGAKRERDKESMRTSDGIANEKSIDSKVLEGAHERASLPINEEKTTTPNATNRVPTRTDSLKKQPGTSPRRKLMSGKRTGNQKPPPGHSIDDGPVVNLENDVSVPSTFSNVTDTSLVCIVCQKRRANVVFEPCRHCLLCSRCSKTSCQTFCPLCRSTVTDRQQAGSIRMARPQIYSSYVFM